MKIKKLIRYPLVSVVIATYNSKNTLEKCLGSVRNQNYPQKKIEIIIADGSSKDNTREIASRFKTTFLSIPAKMQNAEYNKGQGLRRAKGEFILMIDHDNVLPHEMWLKNMLFPLLANKNIVASETLRYHYDPKFSLLDRYFALFGAGDPLAFYLGKADRLSYIYSKYNLLGKAKRHKGYYIVEFKPDQVPTLGANGFLIRKETLIKNANVSGNNFFHIDVNVDLINKGHNLYAFVDDTVIHLTGYKSISSFLYRRKLFMEQFYLKKNNNRRYSVYESRDLIKLILYVIYALTIVKPLIDSFRGYAKIRDTAWFFHPVLAFSLCLIYGYTALKAQIISK